jgi:hypothetical protein
MAGGKEPIEVKFRLFDGTDIGPNKYDPATTVTALKEFVLSRWPQGETDRHPLPSLPSASYMYTSPLLTPYVSGRLLARSSGRSCLHLFLDPVRIPVQMGWSGSGSYALLCFLR